MPHFFLSYRRGDVAAKTLVRFIAQEVDSSFGGGSAFFDITSIPSGEDFRTVLTDTLEACSVVVALIGNPTHWLGKSESGLRISDPNDWVRIEIETALITGRKVIPLLIDGAHMPDREHLPASIATFSNLQASRISTGVTFPDDLKRLLADLTRIEANLSFGQGQIPRAKSLEQDISDIWHSDKPRDSKIRSTQMLCRGLAMPRLAYESFLLSIDIKTPDGDSDFAWSQDGFNLTDQQVEGEAKSLWFENPQTRPIDIVSESETGLPPVVQILRDYANFKDFYCRFSPPIAPFSSFGYSYRYHAPGMFTQDHYWDYKIRNVTLKASIRIRHRKLKMFRHCYVEEHTASGVCQDSRGCLTATEKDGTLLVDWSIDMPKLDATYRIYWAFLDE